MTKQTDKIVSLAFPSINNFKSPPLHKVAKLGASSKYYAAKLPNDL